MNIQELCNENPSSLMDWSDSEIEKLKRMVNARHEVKRQITATEFGCEDKVTFIGKHNIRHTGEIIKCNPKKAKVKCITHEYCRWNVDYNLLTKVPKVA